MNVLEWEKPIPESLNERLRAGEEILQLDSNGMPYSWVTADSEGVLTHRRLIHDQDAKIEKE